MGWECRMYVGYDKRRSISVGEPEGKRVFERLERWWEDSIKMAPIRVHWRCLMDTVMKVTIP